MIHDRKVTALVPIKNHSERVEGKNFRDFCGKPLYHHIIHTLDRVYAVDEVVINTESPRVISEAPGLSCKVRIIERPVGLCGDFISTNKIFKYDLSQTKADVYIQTHSTNPILKADTIAKAIAKFISVENEYDSLFGVNEHYSRFYKPDCTAVNHDPANLVRTQDLEPMYEENSSLYVFTKESFKKKGQRIGDKPFMFVTPPIESIDIDDEITFRIAELLAFYAAKK